MHIKREIIHFVPYNCNLLSILTKLIKFFEKIKNLYKMILFPFKKLVEKC